MTTSMFVIWDDFWVIVRVPMSNNQSPRFYKWLWILDWSKCILIVDTLNQILLTLFTLIALQILRKYQFVVRGFSLMCAITTRKCQIYNLEEWSMDPIIMIIVSKIWIGMFTNNYSFTSMKTSRSLARNRDFECRCIKTYLEREKSFKKCTVPVVIWFFFFSSEF